MTVATEFFQVVNARRSVRKFLDEPVPRTVLEQIVAAGIEAPSGANAQLRRYIIVDAVAVLDQIRPISKALATAPAMIVQLIKPEATRFGEFYVQDAAASIQNMLLAAVALGYASCWVEGAVQRAEDQVRRILGVPEELNISAILPIGRPGELPKRPEKLPLAQVTQYNIWR